MSRLGSQRLELLRLTSTASLHHLHISLFIITMRKQCPLLNHSTQSQLISPEPANLCERLDICIFDSMSYTLNTFVPDERSLGGAHQIYSNFASHHQRIEDAAPSRAILNSKKTSGMSLAARLSHNRAAREAAVDSSRSLEHHNNIYHLNRRIENAYSTTERMKNPYDPATQPSVQKRGSNLYKGTLHSSMLSWHPTQQGRASTSASTRPSSAPARRGRDQYQGWSVTKNLRDAYPSDDFPLLDTYRLDSMESSYLAYKRALMQEIVSERMFKEADLKHLFRSYKKLAPIRDKGAVERAVGEIALELDVRGAL